MDLRKEMIIIDNKIRDDVNSCIFDYQTNKFVIKFNGSNKKYNYSFEKVKCLNYPISLKLENYFFYVNNKLLKDVKEIYEFNYLNENYYRIFLKDNKHKSLYMDEFKMVNKASGNIIKYMKDIATLTSLTTDDGKKILCNQMEKIKIDNLDTALANYLQMSSDTSNRNNNEILIFPFGCNSSQYEAVKNALYNKISIIEGPPGTGKTQTILNIIANIIIRGMNCQVVSNNNYAIENIDEKLKNNDLDFIEALLGRNKNKEVFFENQSVKVPDFSEYKNIDIKDVIVALNENNDIVRKIYSERKELANLVSKKSDLELEYKYFQELIKSQELTLLKLPKYNKEKLKLLWNEIISLEEINILYKIKYVFFYRIGNFKFYKNNLNIIRKTLQNQIYVDDINELSNKIDEKEEYIEKNKSKEEEFKKSSLIYLKKYLSLKYKMERKIYSSSEIWKNPQEFLNDYPIILSTTYSSRNTFNEDFKFDYIIMDESSQIDVVTGTLALSSAKNAVIIGDEKQLSNVVKEDIKEKLDEIFNNYNLNKCYSYSLNSFLSSVKSAIPNIQNKMLVEHYRCHPKIINFCNKKFYNNQLVIMTNDNGEKDVIKVIKTVKGNLSRDKANERQVDEICNIISSNNEDIGIIAPYNNQVDLIKERIGDIEVSTIHKFQGREKDIIIITTVEDEISEFVGDARILNVAISRAKKHLYFIVTGNQIKNENVRDFIDYVEYNNMEILNSKIYSSFDLLYKQYEKERLEFFKKHKKISKFDSENIIYYLIEKILKDYDNLQFHFYQPLNDLIKDKTLLTEEEKKYVSHPNTHLDFYIFKKIGEKPILAIEVDGYHNHKKGTRQYERDMLKNSALEKYNIPLIRLKTNGSCEEEKIRNKLNDIMINL